MGERDVLLLEQGRLTCGTIWHAAGLRRAEAPEPQHDADEPVQHRLYAKLEASAARRQVTCGMSACAASVCAPRTARRSPSTGETLDLHWAMRWPRQELGTVWRPLTSPLYDLLAKRGAVFGSKNGWERANYFKPCP